MIYHTSVVFDQFQNDKCLNDGRCIMPFVASVPFWFLAKAHINESGVEERENGRKGL